MVLSVLGLGVALLGFSVNRTYFVNLWLKHVPTIAGWFTVYKMLDVEEIVDSKSYFFCEVKCNCLIKNYVKVQYLADNNCYHTYSETYFFTYSILFEI